MRDNMQLLVNALWQVSDALIDEYLTRFFFQVPIERHDNTVVAKVNLLFALLFFTPVVMFI